MFAHMILWSLCMRLAVQVLAQRCSLCNLQLAELLFQEAHLNQRSQQAGSCHGTAECPCRIKSLACSENIARLTCPIVCRDLPIPLLFTVTGTLLAAQDCFQQQLTSIPHLIYCYCTLQRSCCIGPCTMMGGDPHGLLHCFPSEHGEHGDS
eukprot:scaffold301388_cov14-Tisochrysis_lutea.AAC.1